MISAGRRTEIVAESGAGALCGWLLSSMGLLWILALFCMIPATLSASVITGSGVVTNPLNLSRPVRQAYERFYILDYSGALSGFDKVQAANPDDSMAVDYVLETTLFQELYRLDLLDTSFYVHDGFLTGKRHGAAADPAVRERIGLLVQKATNLANERLKTNPKDVDALYARGWARSLDALYLGLIDRSFIPALHLALQARSDDEKVLQLSPNYVDAELVVGIHQYVVGSLPFGFKILAGIAGIRGSKTKGLEDLRDAGSRGVVASVEARTALALFLRREAQYPAAIMVMEALREQYPRDFLFSLEVANLTKDLGEGPKAIEEYRVLLQRAEKRGYYPSAHLELAWFGLGETLRGQRDYTGAAAAYLQAAVQPTTSAELKGRCELNAGEMYDLLRLRPDAEKEYRQVLAINLDSSQTDSARRYLKFPFEER